MAYENLKPKLLSTTNFVTKKRAKLQNVKTLKYNRVYTPVDIEGFDYERDLGMPGEFPLTLVAYNLLCTVVVSGQCVCMQASLQLKNLTNVTAT